MVGYDYERLAKVAASRGYETESEIIHVLSKLFGISYRAAWSRFYDEVWVRFDESFAVASYFKMTPKEYADVFLADLFQEDDEGRFVCHVDNEMMAHRKERVSLASSERAKRYSEKHKRKVRKRRKELLKEINRL